jgi:hypothetical protein
MRVCKRTEDGWTEVETRLSNIDDKMVIKASWCNHSYLCYVKLFLIDRAVKSDL